MHAKSNMQHPFLKGTALRQKARIYSEHNYSFYLSVQSMQILRHFVNRVQQQFLTHSDGLIYAQKLDTSILPSGTEIYQALIQTLKQYH